MYTTGEGKKYRLGKPFFSKPSSILRYSLALAQTSSHRYEYNSLNSDKNSSSENPLGIMLKTLRIGRLSILLKRINSALYFLFVRPTIVHQLYHQRIKRL